MYVYMYICKGHDARTQHIRYELKRSVHICKYTNMYVYMYICKRHDAIAQHIHQELKRSVYPPKNGLIALRSATNGEIADF